MKHEEKLMFSAKDNVFYLGDTKLSVGDALEVRVKHPDGEVEWIDTVLENDEKWYLEGVAGYDIEGLTAALIK